MKTNDRELGQSLARACAAATRFFAMGLLMALAGFAAAQQAYPSKPIRFIVPYPPGGSTDPIARLVGRKLADRWGQPVVVENRPGGNTIIGTDAVAKAPPDGHTFLLAAVNFVTNPGGLPSLPYDTVKDFDAVGTIVKSRYVIAANPSVPANTLQELVALAKARPGQLNYGSSGVGSGVHLAGALFNSMVGTNMQHVPYKGGGQVLPDLIGGHVQLSFQAPVSVLSLIRSGKLKALAISGKTRLATLPQVPTFAEGGLPGYEMVGWYGIVAPAGTPKEIINKISGDMAIVLAMPDVQEYLTKEGMEPFVSTPAQTGALIKSDIAMYTKIIKAANIKME